MKTIAYILFFTFSAGISNAQEASLKVAGSAGESWVGDNVQLDWTIGEVVISTIANSSHMISQGMHQPNYLVTSDDLFPATIGNIMLFPNPTASDQEIKITLNTKEDVLINLIDELGRLRWTKKYSGQFITDQYSLVELPAGTYLLSISLINRSVIQTYQIIKSN